VIEAPRAAEVVIDIGLQASETAAASNRRRFVLGGF